MQESLRGKSAHTTVCLSIIKSFCQSYKEVSSPPPIEVEIVCDVVTPPLPQPPSLWLICRVTVAVAVMANTFLWMDGNDFQENEQRFMLVFQVRFWSVNDKANRENLLFLSWIESYDHCQARNLLLGSTTLLVEQILFFMSRPLASPDHDSLLSLPLLLPFKWSSACVDAWAGQA